MSDVVVLSTHGWPDGSFPSPRSEAGYPFERAPLLDLDDLDGAVALLRQAGEGSVVLCRQAETDALQRAVQQADPSGTRMVGRVATRLTQSGTRVLADLLATATARHGIARALAALDDLERLVTCLLVSPSVARLSTPAPSLTQHMRSWWPQSVFTVRLTGRAGVSTGAPSLGASRLTGVMSAPVVDATVLTSVEDALLGRHVIDLGPLRPEPPGVAARGVEICCVDVNDAEAAIQRALLTVPTSCDWCDQPRLRSGECPFCRWPASAPVPQRQAQ